MKIRVPVCILKKFQILVRKFRTFPAVLSRVPLIFLKELEQCLKKSSFAIKIGVDTADILAC